VGLTQDSAVLSQTYGYILVYTRRPCDPPSTYNMGGYASQSEMELARQGLMEMIGWTPPKWWQWWRWNDSRIPDNSVSATGAQ
jgi:hypothetical protein